MGWEGFTGRTIQTDTEQWRKTVLKYFIKNSWVFVQQEPRDPLNENQEQFFIWAQHPRAGVTEFIKGY